MADHEDDEDDAPPAPDLHRCSREAFLEHQIDRLERIAVAAVQQRQPGAAVAARAEATRLRAQLDQLRAVARAAKRKPRSQEAYEAELLGVTRRLRQAAEAAGSFVAAEKLLDSEREQLAEQKARDAAAEQERLAHLDDDAIVAIVVADLRGLPPELRRRICDEATKDDDAGGGGSSR